MKLMQYPPVICGRDSERQAHRSADVVSPADPLDIGCHITADTLLNAIMFPFVSLSAHV